MIIHMFDDYDRSKIETQAIVFGQMVFGSTGEDVEAASPKVEKFAGELANQYFGPGASQSYLTEDIIPLIWRGFALAADGNEIDA